MNKQVDNGRKGLIIFSVVAIVITLITSVGLWLGFTGRTMKVQGWIKDVSIFDYILPSTSGVEGDASVKIMIDTYELDEDTSLSATERIEIMEILEDTLYYVNGEEVFVMDWDIKWDIKEETPAPHSFDVKNGDIMELEIELPKDNTIFAENKTTDTFEVFGLGTLITSANDITKDMLDKLEESLEVYPVLGFSFEKDYRAIEQAIENGKATKVGVYYRIDDYEHVDINFFQDPYPHALTIAFAYEYEGQVYMLVRTGLTIASYSFVNELLNYGEAIYHEDLALTTEESTVANITASMQKRGYEKLVV